MNEQLREKYQFRRTLQRSHTDSRDESVATEMKNSVVMPKSVKMALRKSPEL